MLNRIFVKLAKLLIPYLPSFKTEFTNKQGISTLLCHRDVWMFIYCLESFFYHSKMSLSVHIINDGSLTHADIDLLRSKFTISIDSVFLNKKKLNIALKKYPYLLKYRLDQKNNIYKMQLDPIINSPFNKDMYLDADILFFNRPKTIIKWFSSKKKTNLYTPLGPNIAQDFINNRNYEFNHRDFIFYHLNLKLNLPNDVCGGFHLVNTNHITPIQLFQMNNICKSLYLSKNLPYLISAIEIIEAPLFQKMNYLSTSHYLTTVNNQHNINPKNSPTSVHYAVGSKRYIAQDILIQTIKTYLFTGYKFKNIFSTFLDTFSKE